MKSLGIQTIRTLRSIDDYGGRQAYRYPQNTTRTSSPKPTVRLLKARAHFDSIKNTKSSSFVFCQLCMITVDIVTDQVNNIIRAVSSDNLGQTLTATRRNCSLEYLGRWRRLKRDLRGADNFFKSHSKILWRPL